MDACGRCDWFQARDKIAETVLGDTLAPKAAKRPLSRFEAESIVFAQIFARERAHSGLREKTRGKVENRHVIKNFVYLHVIFLR